ncbi:MULTISPECIES: TIGR03943 family putative permease subunit [Corynebacterium]|uniref:TIGR03943 family putative permease subunit n=1 Tax=Corynebacterium TaxID=1716 RepID=UPI00124D2C3A|nr:MULTISPECIES: TIGR03943 family protein [Corynebacterium]
MAPCEHSSPPQQACCATMRETSPAQGLSTVLASTIVVLLSIVLLVLAITGQLNNYVQPFFRPIMILTGLALFGLGVWSLVRVRLDAATAAGEHPVRATSWVLLVPVLLAVLSAPDPLGASMLGSAAVGGASTSMGDPQAQRAQQLVRVERNPDGTIAFPELARDDVNEITLEDLANRFYFGSKEDLDGVQVRVVGFASEGAEGDWFLGRFKIYCCAADAIPYQVRLEGLAEPVSDQWYELSGTVDTAADEQWPVLRVEETEPIDQPNRPYL